MTIKVRVNTTQRIRVKGVYAPNDTVATVNQSTGDAVNRLDQLNDVEEGLTPSDGSTLVYNSVNDKYEVQKLNLSDIEGDLDGGSF